MTLLYMWVALVLGVWQPSMSTLGDTLGPPAFLVRPLPVSRWPWTEMPHSEYHAYNFTNQNMQRFVICRTYSISLGSKKGHRTVIVGLRITSMCNDLGLKLDCSQPWRPPPDTGSAFCHILDHNLLTLFIDHVEHSYILPDRSLLSRGNLSLRT